MKKKKKKLNVQKKRRKKKILWKKKNSVSVAIREKKKKTEKQSKKKKRCSIKPREEQPSDDYSSQMRVTGASHRRITEMRYGMSPVASSTRFSLFFFFLTCIIEAPFVFMKKKKEKPEKTHK